MLFNTSANTQRSTPTLQLMTTNGNSFQLDYLEDFEKAKLEPFVTGWNGKCYSKPAKYRVIRNKVHSLQSCIMYVVHHVHELELNIVNCIGNDLKSNSFNKSQMSRMLKRTCSTH